MWPGLIYNCQNGIPCTTESMCDWSHAWIVQVAQFYSLHRETHYFFQVAVNVLFIYSNLSELIYYLMLIGVKCSKKNAHLIGVLRLRKTEQTITF